MNRYRYAILEIEDGHSQSFDIDAWGEDVIVLEDSPRLWAEPWATWQPSWELIGIQNHGDEQCVLTVVRIPDEAERLVAQLRWPIRSREDLLPDHEHAAMILSRIIAQRTKTP